MLRSEQGLQILTQDAVRMLQQREIEAHLNAKFGLHGAP